MVRLELRVRLELLDPQVRLEKLVVLGLQVRLVAQVLLELQVRLEKPVLQALQARLVAQVLLELLDPLV